MRYILDMRFVLDEIYKYIEQNLNDFLEERGLLPFRRIALGPFSSDITPSLNLSLKELKIADEFASPNSNVWKGVLILTVFLREDGEKGDSFMSSYLQAVCDFLESREMSPFFKISCRKITSVKVQKPLLRGMDIELEVLYLP
ncbi:hypothetical protein H5T87_05465 [bacterium]|nr:hypothetical protein [bacterium]